MARTIARLYDNYEDAAQTVRDLETAGIDKDISLVSGDPAHRPAEKPAESEAGSGAEIGTGVGAVAGGGAGLLAGLGMLAIPGVGPAVAAGWLVALVAGAVGGAAAGGLLGALVGSGITNEHAEVYAEAVRRGGTLVSVKASDEDAARAEQIMDSNRAVDVAVRRAAYVQGGWTRFDPSAPTYTEEAVEVERRASRG
jgi:hypothetical protein